MGLTFLVMSLNPAKNGSMGSGFKALVSCKDCRVRKVLGSNFVSDTGYLEKKRHLVDVSQFSVASKCLNSKLRDIRADFFSINLTY